MENGLRKHTQRALGKKAQRALRQRLAGNIEAIEARQKRLEDAAVSARVALRVALGIEEIDRALDPHHGRGIELAGLHEIRSMTTLSFGAAAGFALVLGNHLERARFGRVANLQEGQAHRSSDELLSLPLRPVFWIADTYCRQEAGSFYGPGLYGLGLHPGRLIRVAPRNFEEAIWVAGEVSRAGQTGFGLLEVRGNPRRLDLTATRRLLRRCQQSKAPFFILRQAGEAETSAVSTRWLVEPALSRDKANSRFIGRAAWKISLEKCRGGKTGNWILEWNYHEQIFQIARQEFKQTDRASSRPSIRATNNQTGKWCAA